MAKIKSITKKAISNRVVVDYFGAWDIKLTGIINNETGENCPLVDIGIPMVEEIKWDGTMEDFQKLNTQNREGAVYLWPDGTRSKVKFEDYCRLHRIMTNISNIDLWKMRMYELDPEKYPNWEMSMEEVLEKVPDEFYDWVSDTLNMFDSIVDGKWEVAKILYEDIKHFDDKGFADAANKLGDSRALLFMLRNDNHSLYKSYIMRGLRPTLSYPFIK